MARTFDELMRQYDEQEAEQAKKAEPAVAPPAPAAAPRGTSAERATTAAPPAPGLTGLPKPRKPQPKVSPPAGLPLKATVPPTEPAAKDFEIDVPGDLLRDVNYREFYDNAGDRLDTALRTTAERFRVTEDELQRVAAVQGVDLEGINEDKKKGKTFDEVKRNNVERGVLGFLPQAARAEAFRRSAKTVLDAQQGNAADNRVEIREAIDDEGFLGGYVAPGYKREFDSVSKPGEYGYLSSMLLVEALKKDPEASRIYDLYGRGLATGNSRQYVEQRTQDLMKRAGVSASTPDAPEQLKRLKRRALREILAYKTVGQWTPAVTMQDVEATEDYEAPNMFAAIGPNVELIGFNNKGQAVYRQESPLSVAFRAIDLPQEAVVSMLEGRPVAEGVQNNANFFEMALEHTKDSNGFVRVGAGLAGFAGAVLFPDLLWGLAMVPTAVRPIQSAMVLRKHGAKAAELLGTASRAREANDFAKAREAESQLRELLPGIADKFDQADALAADVLKLTNPDTDILNEDMAALLASHSKEAELLGAERVFMHPSERKAVLSGKLDKRGVPLTAYSELYNTERHLKRIEEARAEFVQRMPKTLGEYASMYSRGVTRDVLARAVFDEVLTTKQADEIADIVAKVAPRALDDMDGFSSELRAALKAHPEFNKPRYNMVRQSLHTPGTSRLRNQLDRKLQALRDTNLEELTKNDLSLFDRAKRAVEQNNQSRALAASIVRDEVARMAKVKVQPLEVFNNVVLKTPTGEPVELSSGGVLFLRQMRTAFPNAPFDDIYAPTALIDQMMVNAAKKRKMDPLELYRQKLPEIRRAVGDEVARLGGKRGTAVVPVGAPPTAAPAAAPTAAVAAAAPVVATQAAQSAAARAAQAAAKAKLPDYVIGAAKRAAPTPLGWNIGDVASAQDGAKLLERAFKGEIPYARFTSPSTDGKAAFSLSVGDVKIVTFALDGATQMVGRQTRQVYDAIVAVGDSTPKMVRGAFDERSAMLRGMEEAEKMMAARVKRGEPAIKGAAKSELSGPAALPTRVVDETEKTEFLLMPRRRPAKAPPEGLPVSVGPGPRRAVAEVTEQIPGREVTMADVPAVTESNITVPVARAAEEVAEAGTNVPGPLYKRSVAQIVARATESEEAKEIAEELEALRRASDSGDPAAFKAYEDAVRLNGVTPLSASIWQLYRLAEEGADDAIDAIEQLSGKISQLDDSLEAQRAKALRVAADAGDEAAAETLRAGSFFEEGELEALRVAYAAEQAELAGARATRAAPEVFERVAEEAPAVAKAEEAAQPVVTAAPAAPEVPLVSTARTDFKSADDFRKAVEGAGGAGFVTEKGSVYQQVGGVTQRFKTPHVGHPTKDVGLKTPSKRTIYLKANLSGRGPENLIQTGLGTLNASVRWLVDDVGGRAYMVSRVRDSNVKDFRFDSLRKVDGKFVNFVEFANDPFPGAVVLEFFDDVAPVKVDVGGGKLVDFPGHRSFHPGNQIAEMFGPAPSSAAKVEEAVSAAPAQPARTVTAPAAPAAAPVMSRVEALRKAVEAEERAVAAASGAAKSRRAEQLKMLKGELASAEARAAKEATSAAPATPVANVADVGRLVATPSFARAEDAVEAAKANRAVTETPTFNAWFGESKVVGPNGEPLVMFHGTSGARFDEFVTRGEYGLMGQGAYFTDSPGIAASYVEAGRGVSEAAPGVYPVYLSIRNPLDMDAPADIGAWKTRLAAATSKADADGSTLVADVYATAGELLRPGMTNEKALRAVEQAASEFNLPKVEFADEITDLIKGMGYDGVTHIGGGRVKRGSEAHRVYIAFEPNQIKSATANSGAFSAAEPSILKQVSAAGDVKGAVTLNELGRNVIVLFDKADVSTVLHEVAHVMRRELIDADDMNAITQWVKSRGAKVSHEFGEFVGDATEVEKAEELFAQAFETYVKSGKSPIPRLERVFAVLRTAMAHVYRDVVSPTIGEQLEPEVRRVFDKLLEEVPETKNPTLRQVLVDQLTGNVREEDLVALDVLAREAARKGLPASAPEDIQRQAATARKKQLEKAKEIEQSYADRIRRAATPEEEWKLKNARDDAKRAALSEDAVMVSFPVPVMGRKDWTGAQLAEMQIELDQEAARALERGRGIRLALSQKSQRAGREVIEETPVENIRAAIAQDDADSAALARAKSAGRAVVGTFFGGDVVGEKKMRLMPPALRKALETTSRVITHATGDVVGLLNDALVTGRKDELFRYLGGASDVRRRAGRPLLVAGHDYMGSVQQMFKRMIDGMGEEEKTALTQLCDALNKTGEARDRDVARLGFIPGTGNDFSKMDEARQATQTAAVKAVYRVLYSQANNEDFGSTMATALRNAIGAPVVARPTHELRFVETISYLAGNTARNGEMFAGNSTQAARILVDEATSIYKSEEAGRRVAVLIGGFGSADLGKKILARVDLAISPDAQRAFGKWLSGEQWDQRYTPEIQRIVDQYGFNPEFVSDQVLGMDLYVPRMAREIMADALARSTFKPSSVTDAGDAINFAYRYMKVRMTRGNFFLRQKHYMMNTLDHFMQMGMRNGFGVAAASTSRVLLQDVMVLPVWQQLVEVVRKLPGGGRIPADVLERARASLQSKGDALAHMMSVGKYRIEVNPILEGVEGVFFAGGKPYRNKDVRSIAVQEGVFSSYDMSQLANAIQREGALFLRAGINGEMALDSATGSSRLRDFLADWQSTVSDTAEAWGERERLGAMVTLMEAGYDPRTAARLATEALYDYAGSMTNADRSLLVGIMFPFWAFQKNANTQVFNLLFSPAGAYRMMVLRRARERGADALTEILYNNVGNEYGVDVKSMPPELQDSYYAVIKRFEESFDGKEPPPEAKRAMRLLLTGRGVGTEGGKYIETSGAIQELRNRGSLADLARFTEFTVKRPSKSDRGSYLRDRAAVAVPFPRTEAVRQYYSLVGPNHSYLELFLPESSIESGMRHITTVAAGYALLGAMPLDFLAGGTLKEGGMDEVRLNRLLQPIADPARSPLLQPLLAGSTDELESRRKIAKPLSQTGEVVKKIHPFVAALIDDSFGTTLLRVPAKADPFAIDTAKGEKFGLPAAEAERIRKLQETYPDAGKAREERAYLIGTAWVMAFDNSPLGELNAMLLRFEESPLESADPRGELLAWARGATGIEVQETSASETARREEPKKYKLTKGI